MAGERLFLDAGFVVARFNVRDQYHEAARSLASRVRDCRELWTTDAVLLEIGAAFASPPRRSIVVRIWEQFHSDSHCRLVSVAGGLLQRAMALFRSRPDNAWSLADCTSFVVMSEEHLTEALTCDQHFVQAGFRALLLEGGG